MTLTADNLFASHIDPMWIYDLKTLRFLAVNNAAIMKYGYSREEFLAMAISDIRPTEDRAALEKNVGEVTEGLAEAGVWRHRLKSGDMIYVSITGHTIDHLGRRAELIAARDVSRLVMAEQTAQEALAREKAARQSSDTLARQFQLMFDAVPGMFLVASPDSLETVAVSDAYLAAVGATRAEIVGCNIFDALPGQAEDETHVKLRESVDRVLATGEPDLLDVQSFQLRRSEAAPGGEAHYWALSTAPVNAPNGKLLYLMLRMQDVTEAINSVGVESVATHVTAPARMKLELLAHTHELQSENARLTELATRLRTTQRLLETGTWDYVIAEDRLEWSNNVYDMYGTTTEGFRHRFEDYVALVHPDDRAAMRENFAAFMVSGDMHFAFEHQIQRMDGRIVHVKGIAEKTSTAKGSVLRGVVQNVTESVEAGRALARATRLLEIAGTSAKFGAWRYDALAQRLDWSPQTARIHEEPAGFSPSLAQGINYYAPEHRDRITARFQSCLDQGDPFAEILEIITATGRRIWVSATGEAERDDQDRIIAVQGSFQDITELMAVQKRAEEAENLLKIAGKAVRLGGWSVSLTDRKVHWTDGIAAIHDLPIGTIPTFDGGIDYFAPEDRAEAKRVFDACAIDGVPFDNLRVIVTAKGNRITVRSMGEPIQDENGTITGVQGAMQDISELIAAQRKADDLSTQLANTLEHMGDAFFTLDRDWRFTYLNQRAEALLNRQRTDLVGRKVFDEFPGALGTAFEAQYRHAFETQQTVRFEQFFAPLDRTFRVNAHPTRSGLAVYFTDITEEIQRRRQVQLLEAAVANINDIVIITQADAKDASQSSKIVYVNRAFEQRTGYRSDEVIGKSPRLLQGPKTQRSELARIKEAIATFTPVRAEIINYTRTGQEYWTEIDIAPIANDVGAVSHFVSVQRDITQRRHNEEALRISETRFRLIALSTGSAIWEWDLVEGRQWWSDGLATIFGHKPDPEGKIPTVWRANIHPDDEDRVDAAMKGLGSGKTDRGRERYRFRRSDGTWATVEDQAFAILGEEGRALRILGIMSDISDRLLAEERLRQTERLEAIGNITGGVAHDFNNLLTIIIGNSEFLQDELDSDHPLRRYVDMTSRAADRAAELTDRLLSFSRKQPLDPRIIDVNRTIAGLEAMLRRTLGEDIDIQIARSGELWQTEIDPGQLEVALLNLAINSRDAMPNGGALTIETANASLDEAYAAAEPGIAAGQYVVIAVSDTGHGIPADQIGRVFEPFFTTKPVGKGTGLGLSMVYGFVKQTGGHVRVYSEQNEGTTVKIYFPRKYDGQVAPLPETEMAGVPRGQETILVVEDDKLILQQLVLQLDGLGYKVIPASSGAPALAILRERTDIDLLFTDVVLPGGMNGRQVAEAAMQIRPGLKVLYTSGYTENAIVHHGRLDQGVDLLSKPYRRPELASRVRKALDG